MNFTEYGNTDGRLVAYFHGVPGSTEECSIFEQPAKEHNLQIVCFDRFSLAASLTEHQYFQEIANHLATRSAGRELDIIGFSIGTHVAIEVSKLLGSRVQSLHLISAVAPIQAGDFIAEMAGASVFKLAMQKPDLFSLLAKGQGFLATFAPGLLASMLFASAVGEDRRLKRQDDFSTYIRLLLKRCFHRGSAGYVRDILQYVNWQYPASEPHRNHGSVHLWHGELDNWSPIAMAHYLADAMPGRVRLQTMEGLSHYSCLIDAAPKICRQLGAVTVGATIKSNRRYKTHVP